MRTIDTVVLDLDNTLWDWVGIWYAAFNAQLKELVRISGVSEDQLKAEIRKVHQKHGTSEYAFLLRELPSLQAAQPGKDILQVYAPAIVAFRKARREVMRLYPTVKETLGELKRRGCAIAAYTESQAYYTAYRVRRLELDGALDYLYSPADHDFPEAVSREDIRAYPPDSYELNHTVHLHTPAGELKPNRDILLTILRELRSEPQRTVYVGDSLMKDVAMAQDAGVTDVHAAYGDARHSDAYDLLREVTHWPDSDVSREKQIDMRKEVRPTFSLNETFSEILNLFEFQRHREAA